MSQQTKFSSCLSVTSSFFPSLSSFGILGRRESKIIPRVGYGEIRLHAGFYRSFSHPTFNLSPSGFLLYTKRLGWINSQLAWVSFPIRIVWPEETQARFSFICFQIQRVHGGMLGKYSSRGKTSLTSHYIQSKLVLKCVGSVVIWKTQRQEYKAFKSIGETNMKRPLFPCLPFMADIAHQWLRFPHLNGVHR